MPETLLIILVVALLATLIAVIIGAAWLWRTWTLQNSAGQAQEAATVGEQLSALREHLASLQTNREALDRRLADLSQSVNQRMAEVNTQLQAQLAENRKQVGESSRLMMDRLETSGKLFAQIAQQFGSLQESSKRIIDLGADIGKLHQILSPSLRRGKFGELLLEEMLRNMLPAEHFVCQHCFKDGCAVDAIVKLARGSVCIDSKFPLDAFQRFLSVDGAVTPEARKQAHKDFIRDCRKHIDSIAGKYIRPDEGTLDFALMYIPAENVYYETIIAHDDLEQEQSISHYALSRRIICVSPNTLAAYLQVIMIGLKGLQIEENARHILGSLTRVQGELDKFGDDFRLIGRHLENAAKKYADAERQFAKVGSRLEQIAQIGQTGQPEPLPEGDPQLKLTAEG